MVESIGGVTTPTLTLNPLTMLGCPWVEQKGGSGVRRSTVMQVVYNVWYQDGAYSQGTSFFTCPTTGDIHVNISQCCSLYGVSSHDRRVDLGWKPKQIVTKYFWTDFGSLCLLHSDLGKGVIFKMAATIEPRKVILVSNSRF